MDFIDTSDDFTIKRGGRRAGAVVRFVYNGKQRHAIVLDPNWKDNMHAIQLEPLTPETLKKLLGEISKSDDYSSLKQKYMRSPYTQDRAYRTFTISKISNLQEVILTPIKVSKKR